MGSLYLNTSQKLDQRLAASRGMGTLIGSIFRNGRKNESKKNVRIRLKYVRPIAQRWPAVCLPFRETTFGRSAVTMNKWTDGVAKIWKCPFAYGNAVAHWRRYHAQELDIFSETFILTSMYIAASNISFRDGTTLFFFCGFLQISQQSRYAWNKYGAIGAGLDGRVH